MKKPVSLIKFVIFGVSFILILSQSAFPSERSKIGTLIVSIPVLKFEDGNLKKELPYIKEGIYQTKIKEGIYQIILTRLYDKSSAFKRANFVVKSGQTTKINIIGEELELCDSDIGFILWTINSHGPDLSETASKPLYYQQKVFSPFDLVIQYCRKNEKLYNFARLTYNNTSVEADEILIDWQKRIVTATSKEKKGVYFDDGNKIIETESLTFSLKRNGKVLILQK